MSNIKDCGDKTTERLHKVNIKTVRQLCAAVLKNVDGLATTSGISGNILIKLVANSSNCSKGKPPKNLETLHHRANHPYKSRYGKNWEKELAKLGECKVHMSIRTVVLHIYNESKAFFKGTKLANN